MKKLKPPKPPRPISRADHLDNAAIKARREIASPAFWRPFSTRGLLSQITGGPF